MQTREITDQARHMHHLQTQHGRHEHAAAFSFFAGAAASCEPAAPEVYSRALRSDNFS